MVLVECPICMEDVIKTNTRLQKCCKQTICVDCIISMTKYDGDTGMPHYKCPFDRRLCNWDLRMVDRFKKKQLIRIIDGLVSSTRISRFNYYGDYPHPENENISWYNYGGVESNVSIDMDNVSTIFATNNVSTYTWNASAELINLPDVSYDNVSIHHNVSSADLDVVDMAGNNVFPEGYSGT